jgi:hypothetical protein
MCQITSPNKGMYPYVYDATCNASPNITSTAITRLPHTVGEQMLLSHGLVGGTKEIVICPTGVVTDATPWFDEYAASCITRDRASMFFGGIAMLVFVFVFGCCGITVRVRNRQSSSSF